MQTKKKVPTRSSARELVSPKVSRHQKKASENVQLQERKANELITSSARKQRVQLLKLPANSPDAAIFADPSPSTATPAAPKGTSSPAVAKPSDSKSAGIKLQVAVPHLIAGMFVSIFTAAAFFFYA